jgi:cyclopropane fatty-acyl-phospholipid synthase-like methyltransferase
VLDFLRRRPPGRALELGCGTGTNAVTLAEHGWDVTAVDFSARALSTARRRARQAGVSVRFLRRDVTRLEDLAGPFAFALDLGCFHALDARARPGYAATLARLLPPGATYLLYTFLDPADGWPDEEDVRRLFRPDFELTSLDHGEFDGRPSGWFTWKRRA